MPLLYLVEASEVARKLGSELSCLSCFQNGLSWRRSAFGHVLPLQKLELNCHTGVIDLGGIDLPIQRPKRTLKGSQIVMSGQFCTIAKFEPKEQVCQKDVITV